MLEIICASNNVTALEIVWRNPDRVRARRGRHNCESAGKRTRYILQEFVDDGHHSYWTTITDLEVEVGGRAA